MCLSQSPATIALFPLLCPTEPANYVEKLCHSYNFSTINLSPEGDVPSFVSKFLLWYCVVVLLCCACLKKGFLGCLPHAISISKTLSFPLLVTLILVFILSSFHRVLIGLRWFTPYGPVTSSVIQLSSSYFASKCDLSFAYLQSPLRSKVLL